MKDIIKKRLGIININSDKEALGSATLYFIKCVAGIVEKLCIVISGEAEDTVRKQLENINEVVYFGKNCKYDSEAYKYALEDVLGWKEVQKYDELLLMNDSCFGPIYPFEEMFRDMEEKECDFWGITEQPEIKRGKYTETTYPRHIQSYFLVIRQRMLKSQEFVKYWNAIRLAERFELTFTKYFEKYGYVSQAYVDAGAFCDSLEEIQEYIYFDSYRLIKNYRCPLLKKQVFLFSERDILSANAGETARRTLEYITRHTAYDADLIWECLIKECDLHELRSVLHLTYICSKEISLSTHIKMTNAAVLLLASSELMVEIFNKYMEDMEGEITPYIFLLEGTNNSAVEELYTKLIDKYEYLCVINERWEATKADEKELYIQSLLENAIASRVYVQNVLHLFRENKRLGVLSLPKPYLGNLFVEGFDNSLINGFWARTACLDVSGNIETIAKEKGYFFGEIFSEDCANYFISDYINIMNVLISKFLFQHGVIEFKYLFSRNKHVMEFVKKWKKLYVYGCDEYAGACIQYLEGKGIEIDGVIVSDRSDCWGEFKGYPMYGYEDVQLDEHTGIIVALGERDTSIVNAKLEKDKFVNYINFSE